MTDRFFPFSRYSTLCLLAALSLPAVAQNAPERPKATAAASCSCAEGSGSESAIPSNRKGTLKPMAWTDLPNFDASALNEATWQALTLGCGVLGADSPWSEFCKQASALPADADAKARLGLLKSLLTPWQAFNADGQADGLATGYYEPILHGSRKRSELYRYPLYRAPEDLLTIDLESVVPELKGRRVRGRIEGRRIVPYFSRADIEGGPPGSLQGQEIVWIDDPVEVFFLHIQGSGRVELAEGGALHVGYADQNGQPFRSVARLLIEKGELTVGQASLQGMKAWAKAHPDRVDEFLNGNPSYVFFKELPGDLPGPIGTLGSPLIGEGSVAVDARWIPLGAPVLVDTVFPLSQQVMRRFAMAQDTGGAINGAVRVDYFWGLGEPALAQAGRMRQKLKLWVFIPQGMHPEGGDIVPDTRPLESASAYR